MPDKEPTKNNGRFFNDEQIYPWKREWQNMPEYDTKDLPAKYQVVVNFSCAADLEEFSKLIGRRIRANPARRQAQSIWFPEQEIERYANKRYIKV